MTELSLHKDFEKAEIDPLYLKLAISKKTPYLGRKRYELKISSQPKAGNFIEITAYCIHQNIGQRFLSYMANKVQGTIFSHLFSKTEYGEKKEFETQTQAIIGKFQDLFNSTENINHLQNAIANAIQENDRLSVKDIGGRIDDIVLKSIPSQPKDAVTPIAPTRIAKAESSLATAVGQNLLESRGESVEVKRELLTEGKSTLPEVKSDLLLQSVPSSIEIHLLSEENSPEIKTKEELIPQSIPEEQLTPP